MAERKLRVGVVGTGGICRGVHLPGWQDHPDAEVVAACDIIPERVEAAAKQFGIPNVCTDYKQLVKMKNVDVVDVCTPNRIHTPVVLAALAAKKHVLCEKPLAVSPKEIETMMAAAKKAKRVLMVGQNNRFRGISQALKRYVDAGHLGDVYYARAWAIRRNLLPISDTFTQHKLSGGGPCMDIGVHCLDLAMWLMGSPQPVSVTGMSGAMLAKNTDMPGHWGEWDRKAFDVEDFACGMIRFDNGAMLSLESSWLSHIGAKEDFSCMILGKKAGLSWPSGQVYTTESGALVDLEVKPLYMREESHWTEIRAFYDAVVDKKPNPVPASDSLKVIQILDGIYRSQKLGREVKIHGKK